MTSRNTTSFVFETLETRKLMSTSAPGPVDQPLEPVVTIISLNAPKNVAPSIERADMPLN